jgi:reactive intermediate/imine deaminase
VGRPREGLPYTPGTKRGGFVFVSGQVSWDESGSVVGEGDIAAQTRQTLGNVLRVLNQAGADLDDVMMVTVFMADISQFDEMNAAYLEVFGENPPARTTVQAGIARPGLLIEIDAIAMTPR